MKINYHYTIPKKYEINRKNLAEMLEKFSFEQEMTDFFPEVVGEVTVKVIHKKSLGLSARFYKNNIYINFENTVDWLFRSIAHETTHILLREANWDKNEKIKPLLKKRKSYYDYDQVIAILTQAYFEQAAGLRSFTWTEWEATFRGMNVDELAKSLFDSYREWFVEKEEKSIINWLGLQGQTNELVY